MGNINAGNSFVQVVNQCSHEIDFQHSQLGSAWKTVTHIPANRTWFQNLEGPANAFRHGSSNEATLADFTITDNHPWYDISIVPPGLEACDSLKECQKARGTTGFNVGMMIIPLSNRNGANCIPLLCTKNNEKACADAYQFPTDVKTHDCPVGTNFVMSFCPGVEKK